MPGVLRVLTYKDVPGTNRINGLAFPTNKGDGLERPILNDKKVFQFGDANSYGTCRYTMSSRSGSSKSKS